MDEPKAWDLEGRTVAYGAWVQRSGTVCRMQEHLEQKGLGLYRSEYEELLIPWPSKVESTEAIVILLAGFLTEENKNYCFTLNYADKNIIS